MEIKIQNKDKLFLIAAIVGFIAFFLPWIGGGIFGQHSGYDLLTYGRQMEESNSWFLILLPASFLVIALSKMGILKNIDPSIIKIVEIIPIALIIFSFNKLFDVLGLRLEDLDKMDEDFLQIFKIGFPLTLISSILVVFAPVVKKETAKTVINTPMDSQQSEFNYEQKGKELGESIAKGGKKLASMLTSILKLLKSNPKVLILSTIVGLLILTLYFLFLKEYPNKVGKKLAVELCNCYTTYNKEMSKSYTNFLSSFSDANYKKRIDARNALSSLTNPINSNNYECITTVNKKYESTKLKYSSNYKSQSKFELSYIGNQNNCANTENSKSQSLYSEIISKIETIKDPLPDIDKIKSDLLGHKILVWKFDALSEFNEASILKVTEGLNITEFHIKLNLAGYTNPATDIHDAEILVTYSQSDDGWYFKDVKPIYYTQNYIAPSNSWSTVSFRNLPKISYTIIHNGQKFWIKESYYGTKYKGGPDGDQYHLSSNEIYIMSRENEPVTLTFKFTTND